MSTPRYTFHLLANSHLDPVWLWDWKEGLAEGLTTVRTMLELMDEFPDFTYLRGESAIYRQVEKYDPESFERIRKYVQAGRWDLVGGTYVQPDTNMTGTETMLRHFVEGQRYFSEKFDFVPEVAWAADSFGHGAGLPTIYAHAGVKYYAFFRPPQTQMPLSSPAFWWHGRDKSKILAYRPPADWYGLERGQMGQRLDNFLAAAPKQSFHNLAVFYGLGNHGGGPSRRHLLEIEAWKKEHPEIEVVHSGLHRFFRSLSSEIETEKRTIPDIRHELNFTMRAVYSTGARFKFPYRKAEAGLLRAERTASAIAAGLETPAPKLEPEWKGLLFNSFHDILPATCMERAMDEQVAWVQGIGHRAETVEFEALSLLGSRVTTPPAQPVDDHPRPVSVLVWNPHPHRYEGPLEMEVPLDYRPVWDYKDRVAEVPSELRDAAGQVVPHQAIPLEHNFMSTLPWRCRVAFEASLPPLGWSVYTLGWTKTPTTVASTRTGASAPDDATIRNERYTISARPGHEGIRIELDGQPIFSGAGLGLQTMEDRFGAWGDHYEEKEAQDLSTVRAGWKVTRATVLERGPFRSALWVRLEAGQSRTDLTLRLTSGREAVDVRARVFWNENQARLKLVMPGVGRKAEYEVPAGTAPRGSLGEVPGWRWVRMVGQPFGFASDALYNFDLKEDTLRATIVRSSRHALDIPDTEEVPPHVPVIDSGEYRFKFLLTATTDQLPRLADELDTPPIQLPIIPRQAALPSSGSFLSLANDNLRLLALKPAEKGRGWILRLQELAGRKTTAELTWLGQPVSLKPVKAYGLASYKLSRSKSGWSARTIALRE